MGGLIVGWSNLILYPTLALIRAQLGFRIEVEANRLIIRVDGLVLTGNNATLWLNLASEACQILSVAENPRWRQVLQFLA